MNFSFLLAAILIIISYKSDNGFISGGMNNPGSGCVEFSSTDLTAVTIDGYSGNTINVYYNNNSSETVVKATDGIFYLSVNNKVIRRIVLDTGTNIVVGRKVDGSDISLKISGNHLVLRDAVDGYIPVGTYSEFQLINTDAVTRAGVYKQEADLDLLNLEWTPIGLVGIFDGNNHTLANLKISGDNDYVGLFGVIGAFIENNIIQNVHIISGTVSGSDYVGGVCGYSFKSLIINCSNASSVSGDSDVGGICGGSDSVIIAACYNTGLVSGNSNVGGVCGHSVSITACYNTGSVSGNSNVGGVCGSSYHSVTACYNTGSVSGNSNVGGVCGYLGYGSITACYWKDVPDDDAAYGTGSSASNANATIFDGSNWPAKSSHTQWDTGSCNEDEKYWKSLGSWNDGNPVYPTLCPAPAR
ncbi:MAG: hypothetical protein LBF59_00160 [Prevotellaceae bacterium]|jgi:hypothetical protein|nr:hypothetical protein [Prevotellaceae bacterium]